MSVYSVKINWGLLVLRILIGVAFNFDCFCKYKLYSHLQKFKIRSDFFNWFFIDKTDF